VIKFEVIGVPAPKGSMVRMPNGAMLQGTSTTGRARLQEWARAVADAARDWLAEHPGTVGGPVKLEVHFRFPPTKSNPYRYWHSVKPDIDKLVRATGDALVHAGLLGDDATICSLQATKRFAQPDENAGATIEIRSLSGEEEGLRAIRRDRAARARKRAAA
jgi:Holliday junction resolvase RusA-like endonuclease